MFPKRTGAVVLVAASLLILSACTGSGGGGGGGTAGSEDVSKAQAVVDKATADITGGAIPKDKVDVPADPKFVVSIPCAYAAEGCKRGSDATKEAAELLGWKYQMIDPAGDPEQMREAVRTATQLGADAIFLAAVPDVVVADDVKAARDAGIIVINTYEPVSDGVGKYPAGYVDATVRSDHYTAGYWDAAYATVASGGTGQIITVNDPEFASVVTWNKGFTEGIAKLCPKCKVLKNIDFQIANLQSTLPTEFQAVLQANPTANVVWTAYDPVYAAIKPVIDRSENTDMIVVSHNGDAFALDEIKADKTPLKASVGYVAEWLSWAGMDQYLRILAGTITDEEREFVVPQKLLTKEDITSIPFDGDFKWKDAYKALWNKG